MNLVHTLSHSIGVLATESGPNNGPGAWMPELRGILTVIIGAAGISAFPMAARVCQRVAQDEDFENFMLMHAMGANAAGQVASVVAGGVVLALMGAGG